MGQQTKTDAYQTDSLLPVYSENQLRSGFDERPQWGRDRYLALPDTIPERVLVLAQDLTASESTAYDKARAIVGYLRTFPYNLDLSAPPQDRDVAEYFPFDLQQGYCDYYATTMVVLSRAIGLPAPLAVGYASGSYDEANDRYIVTAADTHSWVEIYFPEFGWIPFEPTAGQLALQRNETLPEVPPSLTMPFNPIPPRWVRLARTAVVVLIGGLFLAILAFTACLVSGTWRLRRLSPKEVIDHLYRRLLYHGKQLAVPDQTEVTPFEFGCAFRDHLADLSRGKAWNKDMAPYGRELDRLIKIYVQAVYGSEPPGAMEQAGALQTWARLRIRLWLTRFAHSKTIEKQ